MLECIILFPIASFLIMFIYYVIDDFKALMESDRYNWMVESNKRLMDENAEIRRQKYKEQLEFITGWETG